MALEIKIGTDKAEKNLARLGDSVTSLEAKLASLPNSATVVDNLVARLATVKPISGAAISSVDRLAKSLNNLAGVGDISRAIQQISNLSSGGIQAAAANITELSRALQSIQTPRGLLPLARNLQTIASAAAPAAAGMQSVAAAMNSMPNGAVAIEQTARALRVKSAAANEASTAVSTLSGVTASLGTALAALGIVATVAGFKQLVSAGYDAANSFDQFMNKMKLVTGSTQGAELAFKNVRDVAYTLAIPLQTAQNNFGKMAAAASASGFSMAETNRVFVGMSTAFRALGLDTGQVERGFTAVSQMMSKGRISAEELTQQLGELIPASGLLADALGKSPSELFKAMERGEVSSRELLKLADSLVDKFGSGIPAATNTLNAAMTNLGSAVTEALTAFGKGFSAAIPGINALIEALKSPEFVAFAEKVGGVIGEAFNVAGYAAAAFTRTLVVVYDVVAMLLQPIIDFGKFLVDLTGAFKTASEGANQLGSAAGQASNPMQALMQRTEAAASEIDRLRQNSGATVAPINASGNAAQSTANDYNNMASAARNAASAARELQSITASQNKYGEWNYNDPISDYSYSSSSSSDFETESYAGGGVTGNARRFASARSRWYHSGTPHFATGGTTHGRPTMSGGGIPAVLHSNEAVVPLSGGGAIPVAGMGGFGGPLAVELLNLTRESKLETSKVWEQTNALSVITQNGIDRHADLLESLGTRLSEFASAINNLASRASSGGGGGGGGGGSGGSYSPAVPTSPAEETIYGIPLSQWSAMDYVRKRQAIAAYVNQQGGDVRGGAGGPGIGYIDENGQVKAKPNVGARLGSPNLYGDSIRGFATGSPNAGLDTYGGFMARLHPDEAVIPLPDGRSVPVSFPPSFMERMGLADDRRDERRDDHPSRGGDVVVNNKVEITINAKDANSFRNSQDQIAQELAKRIDAATKRIGRQLSTDDPTKRVP